MSEALSSVSAQTAPRFFAKALRNLNNDLWYIIGDMMTKTKQAFQPTKPEFIFPLHAAYIYTQPVTVGGINYYSALGLSMHAHGLLEEHSSLLMNSVLSMVAGCADVEWGIPTTLSASRPGTTQEMADADVTLHLDGTHYTGVCHMMYNNRQDHSLWFCVATKPAQPYRTSHNYTLT